MYTLEVLYNWPASTCEARREGGGKNGYEIITHGNICARYCRSAELGTRWSLKFQLGARSAWCINDA